MLASALREMFGVQMYKNNARALLLRILSILNLDWLQHARSVHGVYKSRILIAHVLVAYMLTQLDVVSGHFKGSFVAKNGNMTLEWSWEEL